MDQNDRVRWVRAAGASLLGLLLLMALLPSTGGMLAGPAPSPKMWRCGPFVFYPSSFFGVLGTITALTSLTVFGIIRCNNCEFIGWVLLGLAFLGMFFA